MGGIAPDDATAARAEGAPPRQDGGQAAVRPIAEQLGVVGRATTDRGRVRTGQGRPTAGARVTTGAGPGATVRPGTSGRKGGVRNAWSARRLACRTPRSPRG
jgi:hypothetical protein